MVDTATRVGLNTFDLKQLFEQYVGVDPSCFQKHLNLKNVKNSLATSYNVFNAPCVAGVLAPSYLQNLLVSHECLTFGEWEKSGVGKNLVYG